MELTPTQLALVDEIFRRIRKGASMGEACRSLREEVGEISPAPSTFLDWAAAVPSVAEGYARARRDGLDRQFDDLETMAADSKQAKSKEEAAGWRNMIDVRKWRLARQDPARFSEKLALMGADGGPVRVATTALDLTGKDPLQAAQAYQDWVNGKTDAGG